MRNVILTTFSQQFRSDRLLFALIGGQYIYIYIYIVVGSN